MKSSSFLYKIFRGAVCAALTLGGVSEFGGGLWVVTAAAATQAKEFDAYDKELNELDSKIQDQLKSAREAAFWKDDKSAPAFVPAASVKVAGPPPAAAPTPDAKRILNQNYQAMDEVDRQIASRTKVSGTYRTGFGVGHNRNFSGNDSNSDLADRDFHYLFGDRIYDTFDPAIYSQYKVDIDSQITDRTSFFTEIVADPWSYVGQTSEIVVPDINDEEFIRIKQKYWGPNNSTVPQTAVRGHGLLSRDKISYPVLEAKHGSTQPFTATGINDSIYASYNVPAQDIDYEFRPLRKLWVDHDLDVWHFRVFPLADQNQVMTTDDPLHLSNEKDYWQHSGWLDEWRPVDIFDTSNASRFPMLLRGHYDTSDAFYAKDSQGNYLTLLRGVAAEATWERTYLGFMTASRYGLWDNYEEFNNIPGVVRIKHRPDDNWTVGSVYTYRIGMIDREPDAVNQVIALDTRYDWNSDEYWYGEVAGSRNDIDRLSHYASTYEGLAYKTGIVLQRGDAASGITRWHGDFTWVDTRFRQTLSKYGSLRDDEHWSEHISWADIPPGLEPFKIGTGVDYGRYVTRLNAATSAPDKGIDNEFDIRHVRDADSTALRLKDKDGTASHLETVIRDETTWKFAPDWTFKNFMRFHLLPKTIAGVEPHLNSFNAPGHETPGYGDPALEAESYYENPAIAADLSANRRSFGWGLQYEPRPAWTFQGSFTRTNAIPDFPRGLLNDDRLGVPVRDPHKPNIWLDRLQPFLYSQHVFGALPYDYFSIMKERIVYKPTEGLQFIFHAAQNSYTLWGPSDENVNHQGISADWQINEQWAAFFDYSHSRVGDVARLIDTNLAVLDFADHHNFYTHLKYQINSNTALSMEYGVFGRTFYDGSDALPASEYEASTFSLPTLDTEHLFRMSLIGEF